MKPVKIEERVTYGVEFYSTPEAADVRGELVAAVPENMNSSIMVVPAGRAPHLDRHDYVTHAPLFAVVVP